MNLGMRFAMIAAFSAATASSAAAQESWVGKTIIMKKSGVKIGHTGDDGRQVYVGELTSVSYEVRGDKDGWLQVNDERGTTGWFDKADAVALNDAVGYFTERIRQDSGDGDAHNRRAWSWYLKGEFDIAIKDYGDALRLRPTPARFCNRGIAWDGKKEHDKAIADYNEAIRLDPKYAGAFNNRGVSWEMKKEIEKAFADYQEAIRLSPTGYVPYYNRGQIWEQKKEIAKAMADYNEVIRLNPKFVNGYLQRSYLWIQRKEYDKAIADCGEVIRLDPENVYVYGMRAHVWNAKQQFEKAMADYKEALRINPKDVHAYSGRGKTEYLLKKYDEALATWAQALKIDPNYSWATMRTAHLLATCPAASKRDSKRALELAKKALTLEKNPGPEFQEMLAAVFADSGDFAEAVRWQEKALADSQFKDDEEACRRLELYRDKKAYRQE